MGIIQASGFEMGTSLEGYVADANALFSPSYARSGRYGFRVDTDGSSNCMMWFSGIGSGTISEPMDLSDCYMTFWIRVVSFPEPGSDFQPICATKSGISEIWLKCILGIYPDGTLLFYDMYGNYIGPSTPAITDHNWHRIDMYTGLSSDDGSDDGPFEVRLDGAVVLSGTAVTGGSKVNYCGPGYIANSAAGIYDFDDFIVRDDQFHPEELAIYGLSPDGDGLTIQWSAYPDTPNWQRVATDPPSVDYYVYNGVANKRDEYTLQASTATGHQPGDPIDGVLLKAIANSPYSEAGLLQIFIKSNGTRYSTADSILSSDFFPMNLLYETDPGRSWAEWTDAHINDLQVGVYQNRFGGEIHVISEMLMLLTHPAPASSGMLYVPHAGI